MKRSLGALLLVAGCQGAAPPAPLVHTIVGDRGAGTIAPSTQVIRLRFLPEYAPALARFGLESADLDVRRAVRAHLRENLDGYDFAVVLDEEPAPPAQTLTIEIRDRNLHGTIAYDNSRPDKDLDNQVKNEYIGGRNAELAGLGVPTEGGVFLGAVFDVFAGNADEPRFDDAFEKYAPALGGAPLRALSADDATANLRVSVLGALIASSVTHLVGHAVGLPAAEGFHNETDQGCFMDRGDLRHFSERAKLDGARERWCPAEAEYLNKILPLN